MTHSVFFFIESLEYGGAENIMANIAKFYDKNRFRFSVLSETDEEPHTPVVEENCDYKSVTKKQSRFPLLRRARNSIRMRYLMGVSPKLAHRTFVRKKYDLEVAFCEGFSTKFISGCTGCKKVAWVHTDVLNYPWSEKIHGGSEAERKCYEGYDAIVTVSQSMRQAFIEKYGMADKVRVLYNPIDFDDIREKSRQPLPIPKEDAFTFVLVGSLKPIKGYDRLVRVCARLKDEDFDFRVRILGSGNEHGKIVEDIKTLGLEDRFLLLPYQDNPFPYVAAADCFVCASYAEGYSTTVTEAVVLGTPVVTTECSGMREIFGEKECGIICENSEEGLYDGMRKMLTSPELRARCAEQERERAKDFDSGVRMRAIEDFFEQLIGSK